MKFIKLDDPIIDEIVLHQLDHVGIINDEDQVSVNDQVEFLTILMLYLVRQQLQRLLFKTL